MFALAARLRIALLCLGAACVAAAQEPEPAEDPNAAVWQAASEAMQRGPQSIVLRNQGTLALPEGYGFVPRGPAARLMEIMGNQTDDNFLGMIFPLGQSADWFVTVDFDPAGYIKDEEARDWDADAMLDNLREGTEQGNARRAQIGIPPIEVTRWIERPAYEAGTHRLVWSAEVRLKNEPDPDPGVNYNTYVLGREGYISLNLVTSAASVEADKPAARELLAAVAFNDGKRYGDFNASTDRVAAYGIAALVGGVAAKKLGLLAVAAAFFAKFAKLVIVGVVALGAGAAKLFKGKPRT